MLRHWYLISLKKVSLKIYSKPTLHCSRNLFISQETSYFHYVFFRFLWLIVCLYYKVAMSRNSVLATWSFKKHLLFENLPRYDIWLSLLIHLFKNGLVKYWLKNHCAVLHHHFGILYFVEYTSTYYCTYPQQRNIKWKYSFDVFNA